MLYMPMLTEGDLDRGGPDVTAHRDAAAAVLALFRIPGPLIPAHLAPDVSTLG